MTTRKPKPKAAPATKPKRSKQTRPDSQREAAFVAWLELRSLRKAAEKTGVALVTLHGWIHDPANAARVERIRTAHARARDAKTAKAIADRYRGMVADTSDARETLKAGRAGNATQVQVSAARETFAALNALDKITRLDSGRPTERVETRDTTSDEDLAARRDRLKAALLAHPEGVALVREAVAKSGTG